MFLSNMALREQKEREKGRFHEAAWLFGTNPADTRHFKDVFGYFVVEP